MAEFIGLLLLGITFVLVALLTPWFHRHQHSAVVERWMLSEMFAVLLVGIAVTGGALVFVEIVDAFRSGELTHIAASVGAAVLGIPVLLAIGRWIGRAVEQRAAARKAMPVA